MVSIRLSLSGSNDEAAADAQLTWQRSMLRYSKGLLQEFIQDSLLLLNAYLNQAPDKNGNTPELVLPVALLLFLLFVTFLKTCHMFYMALLVRALSEFGILLFLGCRIDSKTNSQPLKYSHRM